MRHPSAPVIATPPRSLCIFRLSALGDCCNIVPVVRTLQAHWPGIRLSWVIGKVEAGLLAGLDGVDLIPHDKRSGPLALRQRMQGERYDLLLLMQLALRAGITSRAIKADRRLGFDRQRSKDFHGLFITDRIQHRGNGHVIDGFFGFLEALGIEDRVVDYRIPVPDAAEAQARRLLPNGPPALVISPCSTHAVRNWHVDGYQAVARHAVMERGMRVVITGGPSDIERRYGEAIMAGLSDLPGSMMANLVGQTDLKSLLALMQRAEAVLAPDSGPVHLAMAAGVPAVGLYAETNPDRAAPVLSRHWVVNAYPEALWQASGKRVNEVRWGRRIGAPWAMNLITPERVIATLERLFDTPREQRLATSLKPEHRRLSFDEETA